MKQDFNNSMDSLLRDYARRHTSDSSIKRDVYALNESLTDNHNDMKHLDADELAAFAENAVPSTARARYVAHLADCDACRRLIIDLRGAEIIASEIAKQPSPNDIKARLFWREKIAAYFATPTLRYVAPALAASLLVAFIVGIMAYRSREKAILVASKQETETNNGIYDTATNEMQADLNSNAATSSSVDQITNSPYSSNTATTTTTTTTNTTANIASATRPANANASITSKETRTNTATRNDSIRNETLPNSARSVAELARQPSARSEKSSAEDVARAPKQDTTTVAKSPPPAANGNANMSANRAGVVATQNEEVSVSSSQVASDAKNSASDSASTSRSDSPFAEARAANRRRAPAPTTAAKKALPVNGRSVSSADASGASPSRRINGRDFRRQGNRWIDTAYAASQSTTSVTRGSEQYRALVGEEPGIGKIAAQLDGEVIVVWKRHAYRIR